MPAPEMSQPPATRLGPAAQWAGAAALVGLPPLVYLAAAAGAAAIDGRTPATVVCFQPAALSALSPCRLALAAAMALGAAGFLFVVPGLLGTLAFRRWPRTRAAAPAWSLAGNSAALVLVCLALRSTVGIDRLSFGVAWLSWTLVLLFGSMAVPAAGGPGDATRRAGRKLTWQPGEIGRELRRLWDHYGRGLLLGLGVMLAAIILFFPEQFVQCFNEDGAEARELARSLRQHFLPNWELDPWDNASLPGGRLGTVVVNPSLVNSYWTCGLQVLLGDNELATRLAYWIWWAAIFAVLLRMVGPRLQHPSEGPPYPSACVPAALPLGLLVVLIALLSTFYVGYNPYMADIANPGVTDTLFTLCLLLGLDCLRHQARWAWAVSMLLASLVLYAGPVMLALMLPAMWLCKPIPRKQSLRWGLTIALMLLGVAVFYVFWGWRDGSLPVWVDTLDKEYLQHYLSDVPRWKSGPLFFGYFLLGCGGLPAVGLLWALRRDAWQRTVALMTILYLLVALGSGFKNLHFLAPLWPLPILLFLMPRGLSRFSRSENGTVPFTTPIACWKTPAAAVSVLLCIALAWPAARSTFTLNRQLGEQTTILTDSYLQAITWARVRYDMRTQGVMSWDCDQHSWTAYAALDKAPKSLRPLVLTDGGPPAPGYRLLARRPIEGTDRVARLYASDQPGTVPIFVAGGHKNGTVPFAPSSAAWLANQKPLRPLQRYPLVFRPLADGTYSPHNNTIQDVPRLQWLVPWLRRLFGQPAGTTAVR
jgi:hypothetical protein